MMNQTLQDLKTRRSCRRYRPEQIKESELEQILEAGLHQPAWVCSPRRLWLFRIKKPLKS